MSGGCSGLLGARFCPGGRGAANMLLYQDAAFDPSMDPGGVEKLYITHGHADHFRGAAARPGARVYAPRLCRGFIEEPRLLHSLVTGGAAPIPEDIITWYFLGEGVRVDVDIEPGRLGGGVEAVAAPGHTMGHVVYIVEVPGGRVAAAGDAVYGWSYLERNTLFFHVDTLAWMASLERLRRLSLDALVPGHGEPVEGSREARRLIEANIEKIREMMGFVEELLPGPGERPLTGDEAAAAAAEATGYARSPRSYSVVSPTVRALLLALEAMGRAERLSVSGVPAWRRGKR